MMTSVSNFLHEAVKLKKSLCFLSLVILFFVFSFPVFAEENTLKQSDNSSASAKIEYLLPYPGILPDSNFYFLKTGRDKMVGFLISDPIKKVEFNLLQADKRLSASIYLLDKKGKEKLIISTISKGENYFEEGISNAKEARKQGMDIKTVIAKMETSSRKHLEILKTIEEKMGINYKQEMVNLRKRMVNFEKEVNALNRN